MRVRVESFALVDEPPTEWRRWYTDPKDFKSAPLEVATKWLPSVNKPDGSPLYKMTPPTSGIGYLALETWWTCTFENTGDQAVKVRAVLGVSNPSQDNKPLYPYLGATHGRGDYAYTWMSIAPRSAIHFTNFRLDVVDDDLQGDEPIEGWPDWQMDLGRDDQANYPSIIACAGADIGGVVVCRDCQIMAVALVNSNKAPEGNTR